MEMNLTKLSSKAISSTNNQKNMRLSASASATVFKMFTSTIYSNPIGTVVREITSNCFDSHVEAGVNKPVIIKKSIDDNDVTYISFIDFGVGISPYRLENIYGVYFESTKNQNNDEIGGFGIGGKTPLAYKRYTGEGEADYDNSFFVITVYNGIKYVYTIFEGDESPAFVELHSEKTTEHNGTEIRIPMLNNDISKFENELITQLYYFDNIIFEGFSSEITNDYKIIRGKNFLYRGDEVHNEIHVSLGNVAYPINYSLLGLSKYDYEIPVAINIPIGKIGVVASRESLDYSESTINYLKKGLVMVKEEFTELYNKQFDNVRSIEDYFIAKKNMGKLQISDNVSIDNNGFINLKEIKFKNFKFKDIKISDTKHLFNLMFSVKRFGVKEVKSSYRTRKVERYDVFDNTYESMSNSKNVLFINDDDVKFKRRKQSYLRSLYGRFYLIQPKDIDFTSQYEINDIFNYYSTAKDENKRDADYKKFKNNILKIQNEYLKMINKHTVEYNSIVVPDDFKVSNSKSISNVDLNKSISVEFAGSYKESVTLKDLINFNGTIYYSKLGNRDIVTAGRLFSVIYGSNHLANGYSSWNKNAFGDKKSIMFINVAKGNLKYLMNIENSIEFDNEKFFYDKIFRKVDFILNHFKNAPLIERFDDLNILYRHDDFKSISPKWYGIVNKISTFIDNNTTKDFNSKITYYSDYFNTFLGDVNSPDLNKEDRKIRKDFKSLDDIVDKNYKKLKYISSPWGTTTTLEPEHIEIYKNIMSF